ncbi:peptidase [Paracoccus denitrificans]|jgi:peptidyl-prolyl cis-trans isomerase C|uniref:Parvulin-like PPIase n=2 Tax=Paracoccus denitrificans TaxID=266 RepID=A1B9V2_PARDP|nr:PpiC-type peptidyl-prolyl cis-trans isomerase [Paracoccus denitrificans PD1222]QAR28865.1 peptidase [Paracoccus denitrificans]SDJ35507.1 peptidyl-prolyl cis-trans isomerase C [Paracoccus denitrificans]SFR17158.1 peptidyl-prolyl cis-trans isomerase C [Paracoccus denitrificans]
MQMKPLLPPVVVNGVTIDPGRIAAEAQNHPAPKGKPGHAWRAAARALAVRELLLQEARSRGIAAEPAELAPGQWETEDEAAIRALLDLAIRPAPADEAALAAHYAAHPEQFRAPSLYEAAHILFAAAPEDTSARTEARARAEAVLAELRAEPRRFAELAARYSACSSKTAGGMLGQLTSGDTVPEFDAVLATMEEGALALAETRYGLHVIRLDARARGEVLPFESVLPQLRQAHDKAAWLRASRDYLDGLVAGAEISGISFDQQGRA